MADNNFKKRLDLILDVAVTATNFGSVAEDAISETIALLDEMDQGITVPLVWASSVREDLVFDHFNLGELNQVLDQLSDLNDVIYQLQNYEFEQSDQVFLPSAEGSPVTTGDGGSPFDVRLEPRTALILFILTHQLGIPSDQISTTMGSVSASMLRQTPYSIIEVPSRNKTVFVCDEIDNATYIFETDLTESAELQSKTKTEIDQYLSSHPNHGTRLIRRSNYSKRVLELLGGANGSTLRELLIPSSDEKLPKQIAIELAHKYETRLSPQTVEQAAKQLGIEPQLKFAANGRECAYFTAKDQELIEAKLKDEGKLLPLPSSGEMTADEFAKQADIKVGPKLVKTVIRELGIVPVLRKPPRSRFSADYLTVAQQKRIRTWLIENEKLLPAPKADERNFSKTAERLTANLNQPVSEQKVRSTVALLKIVPVRRKPSRGPAGNYLTAAQQHQVAREIKSLEPDNKAWHRTSHPKPRTRPRTFSVSSSESTPLHRRRNGNRQNCF